MQPILLSILSGVMLAFSLPPWGQAWLAWVAVTPLLLAGTDRRPIEVFGLGVWAGLVCGAVQVGWHADADVLRLALLPFLWLGLLLGGTGVAALWFRRRWGGLPWVAGVTAAGVVGEWLFTFSPLPLHLALTQYRVAPMVQLASLAGIWGVSFLLWWANASLVEVIRRPRFVAPALAMVVVGVFVLIGGPLLEKDALRRSPGALRVAAVQDHSAIETGSVLETGSYDDTETVDPEELTRQAAAKGARLVVWSELRRGASFRPNDPEDDTSRLARETGAHLVVGYSESSTPKDYNCAAIVAPDGMTRGIHRKLYPFLGERHRIQPGREATAFGTDLGRLGVEICFDTCYPSVTRRIARTGAQLIAMPNFDPPTPRGVLHRLHGTVLPFRAAEHRVAFVRADSNGLSQVIDPTGRILAEGPLFAPDLVIADVPLGDGKGTFYTRWGDWLVWLSLLLLAGLGIGALRPRKGEPEKHGVRTTEAT